MPGHGRLNLDAVFVQTSIKAIFSHKQFCSIVFRNFLYKVLMGLQIYN